MLLPIYSGRVICLIVILLYIKLNALIIIVLVGIALSIGALLRIPKQLIVVYTKKESDLLKVQQPLEYTCNHPSYTFEPPLDVNIPSSELLQEDKLTFDTSNFCLEMINRLYYATRDEEDIDLYDTSIISTRSLTNS